MNDTVDSPILSLVTCGPQLEVALWAPTMAATSIVRLGGAAPRSTLVLAAVDLLVEDAGLQPDGIATVVVGTLQLVVSDGLLADVIVELRSVELFGETFVVHEASTSAWRPVLDIYLIATFLMIVASLAVHFRRGRRAESVVMSIGLIVLLGFAAYDSLVDEGVVDTPYLTPFGGVVIAVAGAVLIASRLSRAERQVAEQSVRLEQTVVERTAALIAANDELNEQLEAAQADGGDSASSSGGRGGPDPGAGEGELSVNLTERIDPRSGKA